MDLKVIKTLLSNLFSRTKCYRLIVLIQNWIILEQVVEKLLEYLEMCFESGPPSLTALSKVEKKIVDDMQVNHFGDFCTQGFLAFLAENEETKKVCLKKAANFKMLITPCHGLNP